jgi:hypothetical protein
VTFAIAEILADADGRIAMVADTKVTHYRNETLTRRVYDHPCLKIVIIDDDIAVAFAGDDPDKALMFATGLRGRSVAEVVEALRQHSADNAGRNHSKSFLIAKRAPDPQLWRITWGEVEDAGRLPRLWIGDRAAFERFQSQHQAALLDRPAQYRLAAAMLTVVAFDDVPSVGGYVTRVTGDAARPFRFRSDRWERDRGRRKAPSWSNRTGSRRCGSECRRASTHPGTRGSVSQAATPPSGPWRSSSRRSPRRGCGRTLSPGSHPSS